MSEAEGLRFIRRLRIFGLGEEGGTRTSGGVIGGVIPNMIVIGLHIGDEGDDIGPRLRWRTAVRRGRYQVDEVGANVGKSRT